MENRLRNYIWKVADAYRGITHTGNIIPALVRFVFAKYAVDNYLFALDVDEMKLYANVQRSLSFSSDNAVEEFVRALPAILELIDNRIHANGLLARSYSSYYDDILGSYNKKKSYSSQQAYYIIRLFGEADIQDVDKNELLNAIEEYIYGHALSFGKYGGEYVTSDSLNKLATKLLQVNDKETLRDFACGFGLSALEITKGKNAKLLLSDYNEEVLQVAIMLNVLAGKTDTEYTCGNSLFRTDEEKLTDALFTDFPFNIKLNPEEKVHLNTSSGNIASIYRALELINEHGRAVITCPGNVLFGNTKDAIELRRFLAYNKVLKAVITLPTIMYGASVNVNLLVLSKEPINKVIFVDASSNDTIQFSNKARGVNVTMIPEGINRIVDIINNQEEIKNVSKIVSFEELTDGESLVPARYIERVVDENTISSKEISNELRKLYNELNKLS